MLEQEQPEAMIGFCFSFYCSADQRSHGMTAAGANSPLKEWFNHHASGKTLCCSFADGYVVKDPEWKSSNGHYRVRIENEWVEVPDDAVISAAQQIRPDDGVAAVG
ncbi:MULTISPECIES: hypothetical protein [unclassified Bradyrhizobium]|uniref:hypothetical protein n=1 Tax=unclassified Bradyrhizobium TaxID=2631580 RepID=UPI002FF1C2C0